MEPTGTAGDSGQGTTDSGGLFDSYLQAVPEDAREVVTSYLKDAEKNVNSRLQEAADIQTKWGPYKDLDLSGYNPELLGDVLAWHQQVASSPDAFNNWLAEAAREAGLTQAEEQQADDSFADFTPQQLQALIQQATQAELQPFVQEHQNFQREQALSGLEAQIDRSFSQIEQSIGKQLTDDQKSAIVDLGESHEGEDWVLQGFNRLQALSGQAQHDLVSGKLGQPKPTLSGGGQEAPQLPKDIKEIEAMAKERLREALAT